MGTRTYTTRAGRSSRCTLPVVRCTPTMHPSLAEFSLTVDIPVQWGELDAYGHVNNTVFFRYFETLRVLYLVRSGFTESYAKDKVGAILHSTECRFRKALFYPDTVTVGGRATNVD